MKAGSLDLLNCYSPTEDILQNPSVIKVLGMTVGETRGGIWSNQELFKGCAAWCGINSVTFPAKYVLPLRLEKGRCVGFGISVSDANDPKAPFGKRYLGCLVNTILPGKGPYDHPERWPVALLWE